MKEQSSNKQLVINMVAALVAFAANMAINFFLSPFVVNKLGVEAYGFWGLSNNIITYASLITVALNAMAGRFIAISYQKGDLADANKYFSSVFFSNIILSLIFLIILVFCIFYIDSLFDVPDHLVLDVKILFAASFLSAIVGLLMNVYSIATFIKNRLELSSIQNVISNVIRAGLLFSMFSLFPPHLWYYGVTGVVVSAYFGLTNWRFTKMLTPELSLSIQNYDWTKVVELLKSGVWNLISRLGSILEHGFDLLLANIFIGATAMGVFSLTRVVPVLILSMFQMMAGVFSPILTKYYANDEMDALKAELNKSIRILGFFTTIPISILYVYGDVFYSLWQPTQPSQTLFLITILGTIGLAVAMPLESLWGIFTLTNKLKYSTLTVLANSVLVFLTVIILLNVVDDKQSMLYVLAASASLWGTIRSLTFLPMYGAYCLKLPIFTFYPVIFKSLMSISVTLAIGFLLRTLMLPVNWIGFICVSTLLLLVSIAVNSFIILDTEDRHFVVNLVTKQIKRFINV